MYALAKFDQASAKFGLSCKHNVHENSLDTRNNNMRQYNKIQGKNKIRLDHLKFDKNISLCGQ